MGIKIFVELAVCNKGDVVFRRILLGVRYNTISLRLLFSASVVESAAAQQPHCQPSNDADVMWTKLKKLKI